MIDILLILMTWSIKNNEHFMTYILFTEFNIGIPNYLLYTFHSDNKMYKSIEDFLNTSTYSNTKNIDLCNIYKSFRHSKYTKLEEWKGRYGYRFLDK